MELRSPDSLDPEHHRTWSAARVWAAHQVPYMASALLALEPVIVYQSEDPIAQRLDLGALPIDQHWHVYLDPDVINELDVATIGFWLVHQVSHLLRHHAARYPASGSSRSTPLRAQSTDQRRWNLAADAEINDDLIAGSVTRPVNAVIPETLSLPTALTAEAYWDYLASPSDRSMSRPDADLACDCGSGCDGASRAWDTDQSGGLSNTSALLLEREVADKMKEHQRLYGTLPSGWRRWADEILTPKTPWQQLLGRAVRIGLADVSGRVDYSYRKPSRRATVVRDVILPALRQPIPNIAVVVDTSGSVDNHLLAVALAEIDGILRGMGAGRDHVRILCCDVDTYRVQRASGAASVELLGGGGTDMRVGLTRSLELRPRPDLIIVLTDGHTPWPDSRPRGVRIVVGLTDTSGSAPDWAQTITIGDERDDAGQHQNRTAAAASSGDQAHQKIQPNSR
jgi:predicted metal-dependent peptidase